MSTIIVNRLTNANLYVGANSFLGRAEEVELPAVKAKFSPHTALGMIGDVEFPSGFEMMNGKVKWSSIYPDAIRQTGSPFNTVNLQVRANLETYVSAQRSSETPLVVFVTARFKDALPGLNFKMNDNAEATSEFSATYYRIEIGGIKLIEIDFMAQLFFVNGSDQLVNYRRSLGI